MTFDYAGTASTAKTLLERFGQSMTLKRETENAGSDPFDPDPPTVTDYTVTGVLLDFDDRLIDDTLIQRGDRRALIAAKDLSVTPEIGDSLVADGVTYSVVNARPLNPAGTALIHTLQVRK